MERDKDARYEIKQERDEEDEDIPFITTGHTTNVGSSLVTPQEESTEFNSGTQENLPQVCDGFYETMSGQSLESEGSNSEIEMMPSYSRSQGKRTNVEGEGHLNQSMGIQDGAETDNLSAYDTVFSDDKSLQKHVTESICTVCGQAFKNISHLRDHMKKHKGENPGIDIGRKKGEKSYICGICGKESRDKSDLKKHMRVHTGEKPFKCTVCDKAFSSKSNCTTHMRVHTREKRFKCTVCEQAFSEISYLDYHLKTHSSDKKYKCSLCDQVFNLHSYLITHMRIHSGEKPYKCFVCDKTYSGLNTLKEHFNRMHSEEKPYKCSVCDKAFSRKDELKIHVRSHTGEKPFKCSVCDKLYHRKYVLMRHMNIHEGEKKQALKDKPGNDMDRNVQKCDSVDTLPVKSNFQTDLRNEATEIPVTGDVIDEELPLSSDFKSFLCNQTMEVPFTSIIDEMAISVSFNQRKRTGGIPITGRFDAETLPVRSDHVTTMRMLTDEEPYKCSVCDVGFVSNSALKTHLRKHAGKNSEEYDSFDDLPVTFDLTAGEIPVTGNIDDEALPVSFDLKTHPTDQTTEIPVTDNIDDEAFSVISNLKAHLSNETTEIPVTGNIDDEAFSVISSLKASVDSQTTEIPIIDYDSLTFSSDLKTDLRIPSKRKLHECSICHKEYQGVFNLKEHMKTHTGEKPHTCSVCNKAFTGAGDLKVHMRIHTGEKPYTCCMCEKAFGSSCSMTRHMKTHRWGSIHNLHADLQDHMEETPEGTKQYRCPVCDVVYSYYSRFEVHMRKHTGEKPYICSVCDKACSQASDLKVHMRKHTGEKPYICSVCDMGFISSCFLGRHLKTHSGKK